MSTPQAAADQTSTAVILRPSLSNVRFHRPGLAALSAALPVIGFSVAAVVNVTRGGTTGIWLIAAAASGILACVCVAVAAGEWLAHRNMTVFLDGAMVGMTNLWGQRTTAPIAELERVELAATSQALGATTPVPITKFILTTGQTAFKFRGKEISVGDLSRLCAKAMSRSLGPGTTKIAWYHDPGPRQYPSITLERLTPTGSPSPYDLSKVLPCSGSAKPVLRIGKFGSPSAD